MEVLVVQFRMRPEMIALEQSEYTHALAADTPRFLSALDESLPWQTPEALIDGARAVILAGAGELDFDGGRSPRDPILGESERVLARLTPLVSYLLENDFPTLGVCYGHQLIGRVQGAEVAHDTGQHKRGTHVISLTEAGKADALFGACPREFCAQYGHKDALTSLPNGAVLLAHAPRCHFSALRYGNNVYTTQFHPELSASDMARHSEEFGHLLPETRTCCPIQESLEADTLIPRFIELQKD